jgi:hypothetical protein
MHGIMVDSGISTRQRSIEYQLTYPDVRRVPRSIAGHRIRILRDFLVVGMLRVFKKRNVRVWGSSCLYKSCSVQFFKRRTNMPYVRHVDISVKGPLFGEKFVPRSSAIVSHMIISRRGLPESSDHKLGQCRRAMGIKLQGLVCSCGLGLRVGWELPSRDER